jgi:NADH-quinone oxidoreductase subunit C
MGRISNQQVTEKLTAKFGDNITNLSEPYGLLTFETSREVIFEMLSFLKNDEELRFGYLTDITAIHYPEKENALGVIYHLHSLTNNVRVRIKVFVAVSDPTIPSATELWNGANWMERETFDFFGIQFTGHPDLRRILNVDDMTVFPMRREYPLEDPNRVDKKDYFFGR